jgi:hypothetical protein
MARVIRCTIPKCPARLIEGVSPTKGWQPVEALGPLCPHHARVFFTGLAASLAHNHAEVLS